MACNACGSADLEELQVQRGVGVPIEGGLERFDVHSMLCRRCGLVATHPLPPAQLLEQFQAARMRERLGDTPTAPGPAPKDADADGESVERAAWLESQLGPLPGSSVLEIGCGNGSLLSQLRGRGARARGIEPSHQASELARRRFGIPVETGRLEDVRLGDDCFDLIVLSHSLETLADPRAALTRCRRHLAPGGRVFVETPDLLRATVGLGDGLFPFERLTSFCPDSLDALAGSCGFEQTAIQGLASGAFRFLARGIPSPWPEVGGRPALVERCRETLRGLRTSRSGAHRRPRQTDAGGPVAPGLPPMGR